jgi:hypothetical protein
MHATIRRYEGVDTARTDELTRKVHETLVPRLQKLEGFSGYYLIEAGHGVFSSVGLFESSTQADEATKIAASWITDEVGRIVFHGARAGLDRAECRAAGLQNLPCRRHAYVAVGGCDHYCQLVSPVWRWRSLHLSLKVWKSPHPLPPLPKGAGVSVYWCGARRSRAPHQ